MTAEEKAVMRHAAHIWRHLDQEQCKDKESPNSSYFGGWIAGVLAAWQLLLPHRQIKLYWLAFRYSRRFCGDFQGVD